MYTEVQPDNDKSVESEIILATEEQLKTFARMKDWIIVWGAYGSCELTAQNWDHRAIVKNTKDHAPHTHMIMVGLRFIEKDQGLILRLGMRFLAD